MKRATILTLAAVFVVLLAAPSFAEEAKVPGKSDTLVWAESNFHYVGSKKCKVCHKDQFASWEKTAHANAWASLKPEEQKNEKCAGCHSVGLDANDSLHVDVGCEACHGPGSDYKKKSTMEDAKLASAAGLLPITEATCIRCHNTASPNYKEFKYEEFLKAGVHEHFEKAKE